MPEETDDYTLAIVCAMAKELDPVLALFDAPTTPYNKKGDANIYHLGLLVGHNTVVVAPGKGELIAGLCAKRLRDCFMKIELTFLVGICAAMPSNPETKQDIYLGDVIVGTRVWRPLSNARISDLGGTEGVDFEIRNLQAENASEKVQQIGLLLETKTFRNSISNASATLLQHYQDVDNDYSYPGYNHDQRADPNCVHRHSDVGLDCSCLAQGQDSCGAAKAASCAQLGCQIARTRTGNDAEPPRPTIHVGTMASSDMVMRAVPRYECAFRKHNVVGIDMEGGGISHVTDCIVVKGAVDYGDSHKNKRFGNYAAATAAIATKGILESFFSGKVGEVSSVSLFPFASHPNFVGREDLLAKLETGLFRQIGTTKMAVYGLGGIGKTQLVIELAQRAQENYKCLVIWISSANMETLQQGYQDVARKLVLSRDMIKNMGVKKAVQDYLTTYKAGRWLLVFDNADDVAMWVGNQDNERLLSCLPSNKMGAIVFTTRNQKTAIDLAQNDIIEVTELDYKTTKLMLQKRLLDPERVDVDTEAVEGLLNFLANLPLAIVQAASYINKNSISLVEYLDLCQKQDGEIIELLSEDFEENEKYGNRKNPVATTWLISFNQIRDCHPLAAEYLSFMACIEPRHIPLSLLPPGESRKKEVDAIGTLCAYSFVHRQVKQRILDMHRLVHLATRSWLHTREQLDTRTDTVMSRLCTAFPRPTQLNQDLWRPYLPHAIYTLDHDPNPKDSDLRSRLMNLCATSLFFDGQWNNAKAMYEKVIQGVFSIEKLNAMRRLALLLREQKHDHGRSELLLSRAFEESMHMLDLGNQDNVSGGWPEALSSMWLLGELLCVDSIGKGTRLFSRVISKSCDKLGEEDEMTLVRTVHLALICVDPPSALIDEDLKHSAEARLDRSLQKFQAKCQQGYMPTNFNVLNIASTMSMIGRPDEAKHLMVSVLERKRTMLGADHDETSDLQRLCTGHRYMPPR